MIFVGVASVSDLIVEIVKIGEPLIIKPPRMQLLLGMHLMSEQKNGGEMRTKFGILKSIQGKSVLIYPFKILLISIAPILHIYFLRRFYYEKC
jgi:hypothetical protein